MFMCIVISRELASTFARLCHQVDLAKTDLQEDLKTLKVDIDHLESTGTRASFLRYIYRPGGGRGYSLLLITQPPSWGVKGLLPWNHISTWGDTGRQHTLCVTSGKQHTNLCGYICIFVIYHLHVLYVRLFSE